MEFESRQIIESYAEVFGVLGQHVTEDYMGMKQDINLLAQLLESYKPQFGTGSPEGAVTSNNSQLYFDTSVSPVILYVNPTVGVNTGWEIT